jgi:hypothetical protein
MSSPQAAYLWLIFRHATPGSSRRAPPLEPAVLCGASEVDSGFLAFHLKDQWTELHSRSLPVGEILQQIFVRDQRGGSPAGNSPKRGPWRSAPTDPFDSL